MATHCLIARENRDGSFDAIYVHFGHPSGIGPLLIQEYTQDTKIAQLLALGALSHLGEEIGQKRNFERNNPKWCLAYERDRGDDPEPAVHIESVPDLIQYARKRFIAYVFVWRWELRLWAKVQMPDETEESVQALVGEHLARLDRKPSAPLGLDTIAEEAP